MFEILFFSYAILSLSAIISGIRRDVKKMKGKN